jgi:predicted transposase YdaD
MPSRSVQRHDAFFQTLLDTPGNAGTLLRERLPADVAALLAEGPPELVPGSFVSKRLRGYRTDRLYKTRTVTGRPALVYALIEHKSKPDPRLALQLLGYQAQILEHWDRQEGRAADGTLRPLPALVTMVVYHGVAPWTVPLSLAEATDADEAIRPYCLDFRYSLVDLGRIRDADLSRERRLRVGLLILKYGPTGRADRRKLLRIAKEALRLGRDDLATFLYYLLGDLADDPRGDLARDILRELVPEEEEERMVSLIAEQWKAEGFSQGLDKGKAEGKAEGKTEGKSEILLRQIVRRFGPLSPETEARVRSASADRLDLWSERILEAQTLADLFRDD